MAKLNPKTHRRCTECGTVKPLAAYLPMRNRRFKTTICNPCASDNMARYWASREQMQPRKGFNPADHFQADEE